MKTTKEMIEVMQAYESGEQIESICKIKNALWYECNNPIWNWDEFDYRVKPKKSYVPFDTAEEFLAAQRKHSKTIRRKEDNYLFRSYVNECGDIALVGATDHSLIENMDHIHERFEFADGTPCGKEIEL